MKTRAEVIPVSITIIFCKDKMLPRYAPNLESIEDLCKDYVLTAGHAYEWRYIVAITGKYIRHRICLAFENGNYSRLSQARIELVCPWEFPNSGNFVHSPLCN